jgi:hypothetical protein
MNPLFKAFFAREMRERARKIKQKQNYVFSFSRSFARFRRLILNFQTRSKQILLRKELFRVRIRLFQRPFDLS